MFKTMSIFMRSVLFCAVVSPFLGFACVEGTLATRKLDRKYEGITALPIARYLGLDDSCNGRRLYEISMWVSSSEGPGLATLLVRGAPVGVTEEVPAGLTRIDFPLDPDLNHLGSEVSDMEIRMSGSFYIEHIEAHLSAADEPCDGEQWDHYGVQSSVGVTAAVGDEWVVTTFAINTDENPLNGFLLIAKHADFELYGVKVVFTDGKVQRYGGDVIAKGDARVVDFHQQKDVASISVKGKAAVHGEHTARLDIRALHEPCNDDGQD